MGIKRALKSGWDSFRAEIKSKDGWAEFERFLLMTVGNAKTISRNNYKGQIDQFCETVFNCVSLNQKGVSSSPLRLFTTKQNSKYKAISLSKIKNKYLQTEPSLSQITKSTEEYQEIIEHPFLDLMYYVNPHQSSVHLVSGTVIFLELTGMCFWYLPKNTGGRPAEINILPTQNLKEIRIGTEGDTKGQVLGYVFKSGNTEVKYMPSEIVMFKYFNPFNQYFGMSPLIGASVSVNRTNKMDVFEDSTLDNMGRVDGVISTEQNLTQDQMDRAITAWNQKYGGVNNAGKVAILSNGTKYQQIALSLRDMSYPSGRKWTQQQICGAFGVPVDLLSGESSSYANYETALTHHAKYGIKPIMAVVQETINELLLPIYDKNLFVAFDDPVPENRELELKETTELVKTMVMTINEARTRHKLDPRPVDYLYTMQGLIPVDTGKAMQADIEKTIDEILDKVRNRRD